jgi:hypothetical protein
VPESLHSYPNPYSRSIIHHYPTSFFLRSWHATCLCSTYAILHDQAIDGETVSSQLLDTQSRFLLCEKVIKVCKIFRCRSRSTKMLQCWWLLWLQVSYLSRQSHAKQRMAMMLEDRNLEPDHNISPNPQCCKRLETEQ